MLESVLLVKLLPVWKVCFLCAEDTFSRQICAPGTTTSPCLNIRNCIFLWYVFPILRAGLAAARMAVYLCVDDFQRALHTFQSGATYLKVEVLKFLYL